MASDHKIIRRCIIQKTDDNVGKGEIDKKPVRPLMVLFKGFILFILFNLVFSMVGLNGLGKLSLYNHLFAGRLRLPFGENPSETYNFTLNNLDAMIASHIISGTAKSSEEYRVVVIGDSSTWGILLKPEDTLSGLLNASVVNCEGQLMHFYNLGYPTLSLTKDVMILERAVQFKPDLIIWLVTLEAFPTDKQLTSPIVENNLTSIKLISKKYGIQIGFADQLEQSSNIINQTIIGLRRELADLLRLQLYGFMWSATSIDQTYPFDYDHAQIDLKNELNFHNWAPPELDDKKLAFDVLETGERIAGEIPIILINEPILISNGENSDIRYNFYYPRWAYDQYRELLADYSVEHSWKFYDFWNIVPVKEFTNSAIHLTPVGENILARQIIQKINDEVCH